MNTVEIFVALIGFILGLFMGYVIGRENLQAEYKKCRYFDQSIERCVAELGWEKK